MSVMYELIKLLGSVVIAFELSVAIEIAIEVITIACLRIRYLYYRRKYEEKK